MPLKITKGRAALVEDGLRCTGARLKQPELLCNKLLVKYNYLKQIAGSYKCERCNQSVEVILVA